MLKYIQVAALIALVSSGFYIKHLIGVQAVMKSEVAALEAQIETNQRNLKLVVNQLDREAEYRLIAESALSELYKDVPDVEFKETLPPNIQNVVDNFHLRIRVPAD